MQYGNLTGGIVLHKKRQIDTVYAIVVILVTNDGGILFDRRSSRSVRTYVSGTKVNSK